jgi:hypothetical protein
MTLQIGSSTAEQELAGIRADMSDVILIQPSNSPQRYKKPRA